MKITLTHDWAYPTSQNAKGYPKGCYSITASIVDGSDAYTETVATGFSDLAQVHRLMDSLFKECVSKTKRFRNT